MLVKLEHTCENTAAQIYTVFQRAYQIEADIIGVNNFPPLFRTQNDITKAKTVFYALKKQQHIAALAEITLDANRLDIHSFVVDPNYFRQGLATQLLNALLAFPNYTQAFVETAVKNIPAIKLYEKQGFEIVKQWTPDHGIEKVAMQLNQEPQ